MTKGVAALAALALFGALMAGNPAAAGAATATVAVTNGADDGAGSFRAAVEAANADGAITKIAFDEDLTVSLTTDVEYTNSQSLKILGNGSLVDGTSGTPAATWDGGLFVSSGDATSITIKDLTFADSFNNGIAVFVPASQTGLVSLSLTDVTIDGAQFHGVLFDAQATTGFNTDDVIHPNCVDPHPVDSESSLDLRLKNVTVLDAGSLADDYDISVEAGCPQDFDGVRADEGGNGDLRAVIADSAFRGNLADGVELDESEAGTVSAVVHRSTFSNNGDTVAIPFEGDTIDDLDDGFDIDEAGEGDLVARVIGSTVVGNFDEGLDFDEEDGGDVRVTVINTVADRNEDEGMKADEEGDGSLFFTMKNSSSTNSLSQDGVQIEEQQDGDLVMKVRNSVITGNDGAGLKAEEIDAGTGEATVKNNDVSGNSDGAFEFSLDSVVEINNVI